MLYLIFDIQSEIRVDCLTVLQEGLLVMFISIYIYFTRSF